MRLVRRMTRATWAAGGGAGDWFTRIENGLPKDAEKAFDFFLRKVK